MKNAYVCVGDFGRFDAVLAELDPLVRRIGDLELLQWAVFESAFGAIAMADWETATDRMEQALAVSHRGGHMWYEAWFVGHLGWLARTRGQLDVAVRHGRRAVELAASVAHRWLGPTVHAMLASTLLELGDTDEATRLLVAARDRLGDGGAEGYLLRCLAPLAEATGSPDVLAQADAMLTGISTSPGSAWFQGSDVYLAVSRAWLAHGEPARARAVLRPLLTASHRNGWLPMTAQACLVDGRAAAALDDHATAAARFARAAELGARHGMPTIERDALALV